MLHRAIDGLGTKEYFLNEILIGRSNADIRVIKERYRQMYRKPLEEDIKGDLSAKTKDMFVTLMQGTRNEDWVPVQPHEVDQDVQTIQRTTEGTAAHTQQLTVVDILARRNDNQIRAIGHTYQQKYNTSLESRISSKFSGHMKDALLLMLGRGMDRSKADASLLNEAMEGMGTKDEQLIHMITRCHWNHQHMQQVKGAFKHHFKRDLIATIKSETSGDYERLLVAMAEV